MNQGDWLRFKVNQNGNNANDNTQFSFFISFEDKNSVNESFWIFRNPYSSNSINLFAPSFISYNQNVNDGFLVYSAGQDSTAEVVSIAMKFDRFSQKWILEEQRITRLQEVAMELSDQLKK